MLLPLAVASLPAWAQPTLRETVVTANRVGSRADELVSDVTVIGRDQIEASTARTLAELLARNAGLQMAANGGLGKQSSVFIRGTEDRHTILLVDGVRVGSATAGIPSWDGIPVEMIERIEILKGPASALYGSDGVGGVVQIFTRKGREGFHPFASLTAGTYGHATGAAGLTGGQGGLGYTLSVQRTREHGFSATNPREPFGNFNPDDDPFEQNAVNGSLQYDLGRGWTVDAGALYSDGITWIDDGPGFDSRSAIRALAAHAGVKGRPTANWQTSLRVNQGEDTSNSIVASFPGAFKTAQTEWVWQNDIGTPLGVVLAGLEHRVQRVSGSVDYTVKQRTINAVFAGISGDSGPHSWQVNLRRDDNSQFGGATTGFAGYGYRITPAWRASASYGTSFVAPSFNQLYFPDFGNPDLQPEKGRNYDLALTWAQDGHQVQLVRFDNRIRGFMTNTTLPQNIPHARIDGWTLGYTGAFGRLALRGSLDLLDPRNEGDGTQLPRRAKEQVTAGADWTQGAWTFGGKVLAAGERFDDAANANRLAGYATIDLYADWQLARDWSLQAKVNNLADREYETALGYNQAGRAFYLTLRWQPK
ncbi:TonB-dependent vitamin B12 receptor [Ramlibacter monticola]|uniref:TonB-dependent receptor n=2 Tax=Ramlibacter monticola TaxID=1926872 RepID=A0A936Z3M5_9BURK|nr:TonB-dependent receptor [Ramlibacter monticola]